MWVYILKKYPKPDYPNKEYYSVGFFEPSGFWREIKQCEFESQAQGMVSYLNGGVYYRFDMT
jgi:hypothetical protein